MSRAQLTDLDFANVSRAINMPDPLSGQEPATKAYVDSVRQPNSWKDSVRVASTANINLAAPGATIDAIAMDLNDRFLAKDQTAGAENGIYVWNGATTPATRAADMDSADEVEQATVSVQEGTSNNARFRQSQVNIVLGTDPLIWVTDGSGAPAASETTAGVVRKATEAEADVGTNDDTFITPLKAANSKRYTKPKAFTIGDNSALSFNVDHNLGTRDVVVSVFRNSGNYDEVVAEVSRPTVNRVSVGFTAAPAVDGFRVVVTGAQA